jgi:hypothetical protein
MEQQHRNSVIDLLFYTCSVGDIANKHALKQLANGESEGDLTTTFDSNYRSTWKTKIFSILEHVQQTRISRFRLPKLNFHAK